MHTISLTLSQYWTCIFDLLCYTYSSCYPFCPLDEFTGRLTNDWRYWGLHAVRSQALEVLLCNQTFSTAWHVVGHVETFPCKAKAIHLVIKRFLSVTSQRNSLISPILCKILRAFSDGIARFGLPRCFAPGRQLIFTRIQCWQNRNTVPSCLAGVIHSTWRLRDWILALSLKWISMSEAWIPH